MEKSKIIDIDGIGSVLIGHSRRAKRIVISIKPYEGVRIAVPRRVSFRKAMEFAQSKKPWINKHLAKMKHHENEKKILAVQYANLDMLKAKRSLTYRLNKLAKEHGLTFNKVTIRDQKTRWGSCSAKNNISLNMKLVLLPADLTDYVILHELVHTRIHNHSKEFWAELDRYVGDASALASRLRQYGYSLL